jgi:HEAT repeat protein
MTALVREFIRPSIPRQLRQALVETLADSGRPGVAYFLRKAMQHQDESVRACAAAGLARVAGESDLPTLEAAVKDTEAIVREAAVLALAHMDTDAARRVLERLLLEGDDELIPVVAEALAQCGEEGEALLHAAAEAESVALRRAAVMGLTRAGASDLLGKVAREDDQWIVRSAAAAAQVELERKAKISGVPPLPQIEDLPWLVSWAAAQGEALGTGEAARSMLLRAMKEGAGPVRLAAAKVLALVGRPDDVEPLQQLMSDADADTADAAFEALAEIARRYDLWIR